MEDRSHGVKCRSLFWDGVKSRRFKYGGVKSRGVKSRGVKSRGVKSCIPNGLAYTYSFAKLASIPYCCHDRFFFNSQCHQSLSYCQFSSKIHLEFYFVNPKS